MLDASLAIRAEWGIFLAQQIPNGCILILAGQHEQIFKSQPAPRRAQDREPGYPVTGMQQGEGQSHEILNHSPFAELIDLDCLERDVVAIERGNNVAQVRPRTNQHRDLLVSRVLHQLNYARCLIPLIGKCMHVDSSLKLALGGRAWGVRNCAGFQIVFGRQNSGKSLVHPLNNFRARAEIDAQRQRFQPQGADAPYSRLEKQTNIGLPESINRLHRIAHQEKCAPIAGVPSGGQHFEQLKLRVGRVLKFVHQDVLDAVTHCEGQVGGRIQAPQRLRCADQKLREIHSPAFAKYNLQLCNGQREHGD